MIEFFSGFVLGGALGVLVVALSVAASRGGRDDG
jgi:hypothetical protein